MTRTVPLSAFHGLMRPHCPEVPRPIIDNALRLSAAMWCERTRAWRHITCVDINEDGDPLVAPRYAAIHEIETAHFDGVELEPIQFSDTSPDGRAQRQGQPRYITQSTPNTVTVVPFGAGVLDLTLFLKPKTGALPDYGRDASDPLAHAADLLPAFLLEQDAEPIVEGALYRVFILPNEEWSDANLAAAHRQAFDLAADRKFNRAIRGQQRAPRRVNMQFF